MKILIIGEGYLVTRCAETWEKDNQVILSDKKIKTIQDVEKLINEHNPDVLLSAAGIVGRPNVDWCETHPMETINGNTVLPIIIAEACRNKKTYMLHMSTGCAFYGKSPHDGPWTEEDYGNPTVVYTKSKFAADLALSALPNVGIARVRMLLDSKPHPANLLDKLSKYEKIIDVENSITIVDDMIDIFYQLLEKKAEGIFHVTNPGSIKHKEIIALYKKYVDPDHKNEWIKEDELVRLGLVDKKRSSNILISLNLPKYNIQMRPIKEATEETIKKYAKNKKQP
ncbi:MAG: sugar nucleotide-binding protein [Patescibacteria group bacterium]|jgi:dTDP-4-dehydrorhamnose reductase